MAASGLLGIKRRIKSITSTKKITKAMGLVATAKLRKCREKLALNNNYDSALSNAMKLIFENSVNPNAYVNGNNSNNKLYIVFTSDSGLCGSYNGNVLNTVKECVSNYNENSSLIVIGQKGNDFFKRSKYNIAGEYLDIEDLPTLKEVKDLTLKVLSMYENEEVGEVFVIYTKFVSPIKQEVQVEKILPLKNDAKDEDFDYKEYIKFEPEIDTLLINSIELYFKQKFLNFMIHSKTSEQAIRMSAMDGATKNANDLLDDLKLKYNRMRQGAITQEITEIVGGAEALK